MKRTILFFGVALWALAAVAEARSWGFDKDTVYEWSPGRDSVLLMNHGTDTLRFDSLFAEEVGSAEWYMASFFCQGASSQRFVELNQSHTRKVGLADMMIAPGQSYLIENFRIGPSWTAKRSSISSPGDTLMVRLRMRGAGGDEDTLIIKGSFSDENVSIRPLLVPKSFLQGLAPVRDVLGRARVPHYNLFTLRSQP